MLARAAPILTAVALLLVGNGLLGATLPGRWLKEGIDAATIAALGSATYFGVLLGAVFGIALVVRLGGGRAAGLFALLFAGSTLALAVVSTPGPLALLRLTGGFGLAGLTLLIESGLNARAAPAERGRLLAIYMVVFYLAQAAGAALSGPAGGNLALAAGAVLLSALPLAGAGIAAPAAANGRAGTARLPGLRQILQRHSTRQDLASERRSTNEGTDMSYRLLLRDTQRSSELQAELAAAEGITNVSLYLHDDEAEI